MSDDWQLGDLALCIKANPLGDDATVAGHFYTVVRYWIDHKGVHALELAEAPHRNLPRGGSAAYRFVKIRPHTPDAEDIETIKLLNGDEQPCKTLT